MKFEICKFPSCAAYTPTANHGPGPSKCKPPKESGLLERVALRAERLLERDEIEPEFRLDLVILEQHDGCVVEPSGHVVGPVVGSGAFGYMR